MTSLLMVSAIFAQAGDVTSQYLKDADFASLGSWTKVADSGFNDSGVGLIGTYAVRNDVGTAATVDATHLASEYCLGLEFRWGAYVSYTQETMAELPNGIYTLTYDVENTNANTVADNYASMFFVQVGDTKYEDTAVEWKNGGATGWTTHTISFVVNSPAKATISLGIGAGGTNRPHAQTPVIYVSHLKLEQTGDIQNATEEQKQALKDAIAEAEGHMLGFEAGEYAPYNNVDAVKALAAAQAIDVEAELAEVVAEALAALEDAVWTANEEEVNAIFDGSFEYAYSTEGNVQPIAWRGINGHDNATDIRYMWNAGKDAGLTATSTDKALFTKFNAFYGTEVGYTMPLKENTDYTLTFIYGGWSDCQKDGYVTITGPNDEVITLSADRLPLDAVDGHANPASWKTYTVTFTTGAAGNYVLGLRKDREADGKQSQYVYGDFKLYTAVPEKTDYTDAIKNAAVTSKDDWTIEADGDVKFGDDHIKTSVKNLNFYQTVVLPAGQYKMTAKAAYRYGSGNVNEAEQAEYDAIKAGTETHLAKLYAETSSYKYEANVQNRWEGASDEDYFKTEGKVSIVEGKFVPNSSAAVKAWFDAGKYVNELVFNVQEDGEVIIGIAKSSTINDYTNISAWTLTRLGDAEADPEVEEPTPDPDPTPEPDPTPDPEKPEIGDVTSKYLVNADFETPSAQNGGAINTPPGWTMTYDLGGWLDGSTRKSENPGNDASQCFNVWAGEFRNADIYQKPVLPAGKYKLTVGFYSDGDAERYAYATVGGNTVKSERPDFGSWDFVSVEFSNPTEGEVTLGAVSKGWFQIDNVTLEYLGEVSKDDFVNAYNLALSEAQALVGQMMSAAAAAQLEAAIAAYGSLTADNSTEELEAATDAILAGIAPVKASVNSYKVLAAGALPDNSLEGWTCTNGNTFHINTWSTEGNSDGTNMVTPFIENWVGKESLLGNGKITYKLPGVEAGYYKVSALIRVYSEANNDITGASFYANEVKTDLATGKPFTYNNMKGIYDAYTAVVNVGEEGVLEFGVEIENPTFNWVAIKNVKVEYIGVIDQAAAEVLKSKIPTTKYDAALTAEIEALVAAIDAGVTYENYLALSEKVALAESSAAAYAANKTAIDGMFTLLSSTNVYTVEAYNAYKAKAEDFLTQYDAGTLNATVDNPVAIHGWHASVDYDDLLLSAFGVKDFDDALHINTWSTEGETDGSEFKVPFYEYWTGDGESLGVATKTATVAGLTPGQYYAVEAWVRVRAKNGVAAADATGITLTVGTGEAADLTEGDVIGTSQFSHAVYTAYGYADAEGNLTINFNVLDGNNVSWLSFKNLKYAEAEAPVVEPQYLTVVGAMAGDVAIVEGAATVESISSFDITFDRPVALAEDAEWATLTDQWGDNSLKAEVLADNNCVVRFSLQWEQVFTDAGDFYLYIPEGVVVDAEDANCINAAIEALITIEAAPATPLTVTSVTVNDVEVTDLSAIVAAPDDVIKVNFEGEFYFQGTPSIVDAEGNDASMSFDYMSGIDYDESNSYVIIGKTAGTYTITLAKASFLEYLMYKAPAEDIVLTVEIAVPDGIQNVNVDADAVIYDIHGRRVTEMTKGLYIVNGKKVIVK